MSGKRLWLLAGLALLLAACGGGAPPQDLALAGVTPDSPAVVPGGSLSLTLTLASQNGFQGQVSLSVTENGQPPSWLSLSPTSATLNVPKGGQAQVGLQVQVAGNAPTGAHALKLKVSYGDKAAERDLTLTVAPPPSFTLALGATSLALEQGGSSATPLTVTPQNGFTGTVSLALAAGQDQVPQGLSLSPGSVQVSGANPVTQTLTLSALSSTPTGTYRLKVRGTSGNLTKDVDLTVTVSAPSGGGGGGSTSGTVTTPGGPVGVALQGGTFAQGPTAQSVTPPQGFQAPYGGIAFTAQVAQGGTLTVTLTFPQAIPQGAVLKKYQGNAWQDIPGAQLSGSTATYQVQDGGALDADGQANGQVVDPVALLTPAPTFTLSDPSPNPLSVSQGSTAAFQVTLASQNGFQGQVTLSLADGEDPLPQGLAITATDPSPISLQAGGSVTVTATVSAGQGVAPDTYRLKVRAEGGNVVQEKPLSVTVQPPVEVNPSLLQVQVSNSGYYGTLSGSVTFQLFVRPSSNLSNTVSLELRGANGESVGGLGLNPRSVDVDPQRENRYSITLSVTSGGSGEDVAKFWVPGDNALHLRLSAGQIVQEVPITLRVVASPPGLVWSGRFLSGTIVVPDPIAGDSQGNVFGIIRRNDGCFYILGLAPDGSLLTPSPYRLQGIQCFRNTAQDIAVDDQGNIYVLIETYEGAVGVDGRYVLTLRKVSPAGATLWEVRFDPADSAANHRRSRVTVGPGGRVYLSYNLSNSPQGIPPYGVVEALDAATGALIWRREFAATRTTPPDSQGNTTTYRVETDAQNGLVVGPDGSIYVAGEAFGSLFDSLYGPSHPGDPVSGSGWVAKLSPTDGSVVWGKQFIGQLPPPYTGAAYPVDIALTPDGSQLYLVGGTTMNFPPYTNQGQGDGLLMVYDAQNGTLLDYKLYGGPSADGLGGLGFTPDGRYVYLVYTSRFPTVMKVATDTLDLQNPVWTYPAGEAQWGVWRVPFVVRGATGEFVYAPFHLNSSLTGLHRILP